MDYEKKYRETLERASIAYKDEDRHLRATLERIFPELQESEDEKIMKELIMFIKKRDRSGCDYDYDKWIAWLEKQGKQEPSDKVEPKFHEGDWLIENHINNYARFVQILEIVNVQGKNRYRISRDLHNDEDVTECLFIEDNWHPFNINDAKDGDMLASKDGADIVIFRNFDSNTNFLSYYNIKRKGELGWSNNRFIPATKEQRATLFAKMKEAGYEWDAEQKKLKKIKMTDLMEDEPENYKQQLMSGITNLVKDYIEQEPVKWNEEDIFKVQRICKYLNEVKKYYADITEVRECIDWLKSLEQRIGGKVMTQENKEILLRDLCSRLPYGVILNCCNLVGEKLYTIDCNGLVNNDYDLEEVKPYLFPLSSMTEEQKKEYQYITERWMYDSSYSISDSVDWLNKNHFDYRGLISIGLAVAVTEENNPYKYNKV